MTQDMKKWILLVSGSKGWEHYKHQANVCLHYQIIKEHRIPDEQIVVMMYDDIAHNPENSKSDGKITSIIDGQDVYSGVPKDYTGADVTPENFLSALQGEERPDKKKVIASGPNDNIFIYMSSVGQESGFQFPEKALKASDFTDALKCMHGCKTFSKVLFALASCHKYIENTPTDYDKDRKVYLSDLFSSTWLKYLNDVKDKFKTETFHDLVKSKQSKYLGNIGDEPCPCVFGDEKITKCHLSDFLEK